MITWKEAEARIASGGTLSREELRQVISSAGSRTAAESERLFQACPEWVAEEKAREERFAAERARLAENQAPLVLDLQAAGFAVRSVWDLVNTSASYPEAIPVLEAHLDRPYDPRIREGIIRALTVPEARGATARRILDELKRADNENRHVRWALANALTVVADREMIEEIEALLGKEREESVQRLLKSAAIKAKKRRG